mgnify:CR=1 FL=1
MERMTSAAMYVVRRQAENSQPITFDMVEIDETSLLVRLRREQDSSVAHALGIGEMNPAAG